MAKYKEDVQLGGADHAGIHIQAQQAAEQMFRTAVLGGEEGVREIGTRTTPISREVIEAAIRARDKALAKKNETKEQSAPVPAPEQVAKTTEDLRQSAKQENRAWADTLDKMKKPELAKLLENEGSPFAQALFDLQAQKKLSQKTAAALDQIQKERPTKKPEASSWSERLKDAAKAAVVGAGAISAFGVTGAAALASAAMVGAEALYRAYDARKKNEEVKGFLPGAKALGEKLNGWLDKSAWFVGEETLRARAAASEAAMQLNADIRKRVVSLAEEKKETHPGFVKAINGLLKQYADLEHSLDANAAEMRQKTPWPELYPGIPWIPEMTSMRGAESLQQSKSFEEEPYDPGTRTIPMSSEYTPTPGETRTIWRPSSPEALAAKPLAPKDADIELGDRTFVDLVPRVEEPPVEVPPAVIPETAPITVALERGNKSDKKVDAELRFQTIAVEGAEGVYKALPAMRTKADELDQTFKSSDPSDPKCSELLAWIAEESLRLAAQARQLKIEAFTTDPSVFAERQRAFLESAGLEVDISTFDPGTWALERLADHGIGDPNRPDSNPPQVKEAQHFLKGMISTISIARDPWRHHD